MSFILDALKRSEKEGRPASGPDLHAVHAAAGGSNHRRLGPFFLFLVLAANALLLLWLLRPWAPVANPSPPAETTPTVRNEAGIKAAAVAFPSVSPERASLQAPPGWDVLPVAPATPAVPEKKAARQERTAIPYLQELPGEIQRQIPELSVTLHYYTADAAARLARINGRILREGQAVNPHLIVERITANTIIFRQGDTRFRVGEF